MVLSKHRSSYTSLTALLVAAMFAAACASHTYTLMHSATPYARNDPTPYYLYLPINYSPDREWPVFVGIHGDNGSGRDCLSTWQAYADEAGYVLVCPSLAQPGGGWYQDDGDAALEKILAQVAQECHIQPRIYLAGVSAGATFAQGYAFAHSDSVAAVASLSAGNYYAPDPAAQQIIFLVTIGDQDDPGAIQDAHLFNQALMRAGFSAELHILPGVGHTLTPDAKELTIALFKRVFKN